MQTIGSRRQTGRLITVGYDGSVRARRAVEWAVAEAAHGPTTVRIVACYSPPTAVEPWVGATRVDLDRARAGAELELGQVADAVARRHPTVTIEQAAILGPPAERLVTLAIDADLLVVGTAGHRVVDAWRLGSVADAAVRHAPCPIVLVPDTTPPGAPHDRNVVGIDGSPAADRALAWAADEAEVRDAELLVVHVWLYPYATELASPDGRDLTRVDAALVLDAAVERVRARQRGPVRGALVEGIPGTALVEHAAGADLVVVGSRGRSVVRSMLFGSVAHTVSARATCPTVVIRDAELVP